MTENPKDQVAKSEDKVRMDLLDLDALAQVARVMEFGAITRGYGVQNYVTVPIQERVYIAATLRHLMALQGGEDVAPDSELDHWAHIAANAMIVLKSKLAGSLVDDRGPAEPGPHPINHQDDEDEVDSTGSVIDRFRRPLPSDRGADQASAEQQRPFNLKHWETM